jgi:hypothetical protein
MKKKIVAIVALCAIVSSAYSSITLLGIYQSGSSTSFWCALISTNVCAVIANPPDPSPTIPWRIVAYNPNGTVRGSFGVKSYTIKQSPDRTTVTYQLP